MAACCGVLLVTQSGAHAVGCHAPCDRSGSHLWTAARPDAGGGDLFDDDDDDDSDDAAGALLAPAPTTLTADHSQTALPARSECGRPRSLESDGHSLRGPPQSGRLDFDADHRGHPHNAFSLPECTHHSGVGDPERVAPLAASGKSRSAHRHSSHYDHYEQNVDDPGHGDGSGGRSELGRPSFVSAHFSIPRQRSVNERRAE